MRRVAMVAWYAVVAALAACAVNVLWDAEETSRYRGPGVLAVVLALAATASLVLVDRWPLLVTAVASCAVLGLTIGDWSRWVAVLGPVLCLPWLVRRLPLPAVAAVAIGVAFVAAGALREEPYVDGWQAVTALYVLPMLAAGLVLRRWWSGPASIR